MESTRRQFLIRAGVVAMAVLAPTRLRAQGGHPNPRAGITAANVLGRAELGDDHEAIEVFDQVRQIPGIVDGIRCYCGCDELPDHYSLLSCFERDGMARFCEICKGEAKLAFDMHRQNKSLAEIRTAIDKQFG